MALTKAQLMDVPGGPGVVGAIKAGTGITITADGTISTTGAFPSPVGQAGKFLSSDGTNTYWATTIGVTVGSAPPTSVPAGSLYWDNNLGEMFIYYYDGATTQWVQTNYGPA